MNERLKSELEALRAQYGFPGATAAYVLRDGTEGRVAVGLADLEAKTPMLLEARMLAASIGKTFVAATVLSLAQEGRLGLDDSLSKWLGDRAWFSRLPNHANITLRHLLTHSAGLPDHVHEERFLREYASKWADGGIPFSPEELVGCILDKPALFPAGQGWRYTDTGYVLLGLVIEAASGKSYYAELKSRFLEPLHLDDTAPSDRPCLPGLVPGYTAPNNPFGLPVKTTREPGMMVWNPGMEWTGGGIVSTARDLARWAKILYEGLALPGDYRKELLRAVPVGAVAPGMSYGAGVVIGTGGSWGKVLGHWGVIPGYTSSMRYFVEHEVAVAFQVNTDVGVWDRSTPLVSDMEDRLAQVILEQVKHERYSDY